MRGSIYFGILVVALSACHRHEARPRDARTEPVVQPSAGAFPVPVDRKAALVRRADEALAASQQLDYRQPFATDAIDLDPLSRNYLEACRAGDNRSCWIATVVGYDDLSAGTHIDEAHDLIRERCAAGDLMSCRAIPPVQVHSASELPGHYNRSCPEKCRVDPSVLRQECDEGFPRSCIEYGLSKPFSAERNAEYLAKAMTLARQGCELGILHECEWISWEHNPETQLRAEQRMCELSAIHCADLGALLRARPLEARDAYERLCQLSPVHHRSDDCQPLLEGYRKGDFPEPVPGRLEALELWAKQQPPPSNKIDI